MTPSISSNTGNSISKERRRFDKCLLMHVHHIKHSIITVSNSVSLETNVFHAIVLLTDISRHISLTMQNIKKYYLFSQERIKSVKIYLLFHFFLENKKNGGIAISGPQS